MDQGGLAVPHFISLTCRYCFQSQKKRGINMVDRKQNKKVLLLSLSLAFSILSQCAFGSQEIVKRSSTNQRRASLLQKAKSVVVAPFRFFGRQTKIFWREQTDPSFRKTSFSGRMSRIAGAIVTVAIVGGAPGILLAGGVLKGIKGRGGASPAYPDPGNTESISNELISPNLISNPRSNVSSSHKIAKVTNLSSSEITSLPNSPIARNSSVRSSNREPLSGKKYFNGNNSGELVSATGKQLGKLNGNKYDPESTSNPYGRHGSQYSAESINNPYSEHGSKYSANGIRNTYTTGGPKIVSPNGEFLGTVNSNKYDPKSISNPYGIYGSSYSSKSINNPNGKFGNPYSSNYTKNPLGG